MLDPVAVALKFGFLAVLFLFLVWTVRSTLKDLRGSVAEGGTAPAPADYDATGLRSASQLDHASGSPPKLRVATAAGLAPGSAYDLSRGAVLGRGEVDIVLEDSFASAHHARLVPHGGVIVLEDLGSTNGTYLNGEPLRGPQPLHVGDRIRIGDSEFTFER